MPNDTAQFGIRISGDASGGVNAIELTNAQLQRLSTNVDRVSQSMQRNDPHARNTSKNFNIARNGAQQLGFQVQDIAVQLQGGQSPFVVLSQQGSQLASLLGPGGALIGAAIAVGGAIGGALLPALFSAESAMDRVSRAAMSLDGSIEIAGDGTVELTKQIRELARVSGVAASAQLRNQILETNDAINLARDSFRDLVSDLVGGFFSTTSFEEITSILPGTSREFHSLVRTLDLTSDSAMQLQTILRGYGRDGDLDRFAERFNEFFLTLDDPDERIREFQVGLNEIIQTVSRGEVRLEALNALLEGTDDQLQKINDTAKNFSLDEINFNGDLGIAQLEDLARTLSDPLDVPEPPELFNSQDEFRTLEQRYGDRERLLQESYNREREIIEFNTRDNAVLRDELLANLDKETQERRLRESDDFWARYLDASRRNLESVDELSASLLENFSSRAGQALESFIFDAQSFDDAIGGLAESLGRTLVSAVGQLAAEWLAFQLVQQVTGKATQASAATAISTNAQAAALQAGINAYSSTAAIPIVGPAAAPAAAGEALAFTQPLAAAISSAAFAGAFENGGFIPAGSAGLVAEAGPEIIRGPAFVTSARSSERLLSGGGGANQNITIAPVVAGTEQFMGFLKQNLSYIAREVTKLQERGS